MLLHEYKFFISKFSSGIEYSSLLNFVSTAKYTYFIALTQIEF